MAKRIYRNDMTQAQKDKIAAANVGKHLSQATRDKISRALTQYWQRLPYKPAGASGTTGRATATSCTTDQQLRAATGSTPTPPTPPLSPYRTPPKTRP